MGVFDGNVKTVRRVLDPITDKQVSSVASLILPAICSPTALLYAGTDVSVVHGDQQLCVDLNRTMKVCMNQDVTIGMNEIYLVNMNQTIAVMQDYTQSVMMNSTVSVTGNYFKSVLCDYSKTISGTSTSTIMGDYIKIVQSNYGKTIQGNSDNNITGGYTKIVLADYMKNVTGAGSTTVMGDYVKILMSNYSKAISGISIVNVMSDSTVNYIGNHSRTCGNDQKIYIAGTNTHTTVGPTIRTEIDVAVTQQIDNHVDAHPTNLNQSKTDWFTTVDRKGTWQRYLKLDYTTGFANTAAVLKVDGNLVNVGLNSTTNSIFGHKWDCGVLAHKTVAFDNNVAGFNTKMGGIKSSTFATASKISGGAVHGGATAVKFVGSVFHAIGATIKAGVIWAFNQIM